MPAPAKLTGLGADVVGKFPGDVDQLVPFQVSVVFILAQ
jgi:hypothetical protein